MVLNLPDQTELEVSLDTEASGLFCDDGARVSIVSLAWEGDSRVYAFDQGPDTWLGPKWGLPKKFKGRSLFDDLTPNLEMDAWTELCEWLPSQRLIFHNSKYDMQIMAAGLRNLPGTGVELSGSYHWDSMVVCPLLWPNEKVALKAVSAVNWGEIETEPQKALQKWLSKNCGKDKRYDLIPWDVVGPYAQKDAELTYRLYRLQLRLIEEGHTDWRSVDREIDLALVLYHMERAGVGWDVPAAHQVSRTLHQQSRELTAELSALLGVRHAPTEHDMRRYWFIEQGYAPVKMTDGDAASVAKDVVRELAKQGAPGAAAWEELNKVNTALSMWFDGWTNKCGSDGRLRTSYRQLKSETDLKGNFNDTMKGTVSSRLAVERIQLQAIPHFYQMPANCPRTVRSIFTPRPGYRLWELDLSQAEYRGIAGLSQCRGLIDEFEAGGDAHNATCKLVFKIQPGHRDWDERRQISKRLNFAIIYGAGIDTLVFQIKLFTGIEVSRDEATGWWEDAKGAMPEVFRYGYKIRKQAERRRCIELVGGKMRHFGPLEFTHKALNAMIQGSVAVGMADAMIDMHAEFGPGVILLQIHDSVVLELPEGGEEPYIARAKTIMNRTFEEYFNAPFRTDSKEFGFYGEKTAA